MKYLRFCLLGCLLLPFSIFAQDDIRGAIDIFGSAFNAAYVFNQEASGGSLIEMEDGLYQLQLTGIPAATAIVKVNPPGLLTYATENLAIDWTNAIENAADDDVTEVLAELSINGDTVVLALQSATYDAVSETMTYSGEIVQFIPFAANQEFNLGNATSSLEKANIPGLFGDATLTISASAQFWNSLQNGANFRLAAIRSDENAQCDEARAVLTELTSQLNAAMDSEHDNIATLSQQINYTESWLNANCN